MEDWHEYRGLLNQRFKELGELSPETMKGFAVLENAGSKNGPLDAKTRELISLAVAVTTRCDGCIAFHADGARKAGATRAELAAALSVAISLNAGAALVYSARALDAFDKPGSPE